MVKFNYGMKYVAISKIVSYGSNLELLPINKVVYLFQTSPNLFQIVHVSMVILLFIRCT